MSANAQQDFSVDLLRVYYGRLFPYDSMYNWLSYDSAPVDEACCFGRREWSFTIEDDIYIRYQSFSDKEEMMAAIQKRQPHKIDIGAVFTVEPANRTTVRPEAFKTVERELVFDVDMTDYDNIRTCCTGANICKKCWPFMTMALKVVDRALREDFGFKHILWVYSGRRGIHCWVCDSTARALPNDARDAIVKYLSIDHATEGAKDENSKPMLKHPLHPMLKRAYNILEPLFEKHIADESGQGIFSDMNKCIRILNSLPDENIRTKLHDAWKRSPELTGIDKWQQLKAAITPAQSLDQNTKKRKVNFPELDAWRHELVFSYCYPRLDVNVSKQQNHLLKSPFCVHPKTGRVCVPIDPALAEEFDPFVVPTLGKLCLQMDEFERSHPGSAEQGVRDVDKTELRDAITRFERCFLKDLLTSVRRERRDKAELVAAETMDF